MLTPDKIKGKEFQTTGRGSYRAEDVDSFIEEVYTSYDQAFRENGEIIKKMSILANKVEEYKKDEDSLRQALLSAQKLADKITADAKENAELTLSDASQKAEAIVSDAVSKADKILADAKSTAETTIYDSKKEAEKIIGDVNRKVTQETMVFEMLQKEVSEFRSKMMNMYKEHLTLLDRLPEIAEENLHTAQETEETVDKEIEKSEDNSIENDFVSEPVVEDISTESEPETSEVIEDADTIEDVEEKIKDTEENNDDIEPEEGFAIYNYEDTTDILNDEPVTSSDDKFVIDSNLFDTDDDLIEEENSVDNIKETKEEFTLDISDVELDDEPLASVENNYNSVSEENELYDDDDEDDGALSFKSFFKKK